jgi:hypothetical protein
VVAILVSAKPAPIVRSDKKTNIYQPLIWRAEEIRTPDPQIRSLALYTRPAFD